MYILYICRSLSIETSLLSDTDDEDFSSRPPLHHLQRKQRRKPSRQTQEDDEERPIIRGLWVQEIDWLRSAGRDVTSSSSAEIIPPPPQFTDSVSQPCSHGDLCEGSEDRAAETESSSEDRGDSEDQDSEDQDSVYTHESESDESDVTEAPDRFAVAARMSNLTFDLMQVSGFTCSHAEWDSDSAGCVQSLLGDSDTQSTVNTSQCAFSWDDMSDIETVLDGLRGKVTQMPKLFVPVFFKDLIKQTLNDRKTSRPVNEGLIFHHVRCLHTLYFVI